MDHAICHICKCKHFFSCSSLLLLLLIFFLNTKKIPMSVWEVVSATPILFSRLIFSFCISSSHCALFQYVEIAFRSTIVDAALCEMHSKYYISPFLYYYFISLVSLVSLVENFLFLDFHILCFCGIHSNKFAFGTFW